MNKSKANAIWKIKTLTHIRGMGNDELLSETIESGAGDDYEGCFTDRGQWSYEAMQYELRARLYLAGFINLPVDFKPVA